MSRLIVFAFIGMGLSPVFNNMVINYNLIIDSPFYLLRPKLVHIVIKYINYTFQCVGCVSILLRSIWIILVSCVLITFRKLIILN